MGEREKKSWKRESSLKCKNFPFVFRLCSCCVVCAVLSRKEFSVIRLFSSIKDAGKINRVRVEESKTENSKLNIFRSVNWITNWIYADDEWYYVDLFVHGERIFHCENKQRGKKCEFKWWQKCHMRECDWIHFDRLIWAELIS